MPHKLLDAATPTDSRGAEQFIALVADKLAATDRLFRDCLASDVPFIQKSGEYIFDGGGKRMRPALLLLCARMLDRDGEEEVTYAAVVELIHTATLIHDDIIDHSALRRGRQTINELWGNNLTVLLGDWLYTTAHAAEFSALTCCTQYATLFALFGDIAGVSFSRRLMELFESKFPQAENSVHKSIMRILFFILFPVDPGLKD